MSSEGKAKHGAAGASNAKSISFRYGGKPANYSTTLGTPWSHYGNGSRLVLAMVIGNSLPSFDPSEKLLTMTENSMARCTSPFLTYRPGEIE